jgi:hypothetical protein
MFEGFVEELGLAVLLEIVPLAVFGTLLLVKLLDTLVMLGEVPLKAVFGTPLFGILLDTLVILGEVLLKEL